MRAAIGEIGESVRWVIKARGGYGEWQYFWVCDLADLRGKRKRCYYLAHNGERFAETKDWLTLMAEAPEVLDWIKRRVLAMDRET